MIQVQLPPKPFPHIAFTSFQCFALSYVKPVCLVTVIEKSFYTMDTAGRSGRLRTSQLHPACSRAGATRLTFPARPESDYMRERSFFPEGKGRKERMTWTKTRRTKT